MRPISPQAARYALNARPAARKIRCRGRRHLFLGCLRPGPRATAALGAAVTATVLPLVAPQITQRFVDDAIGGASARHLGFVAVGRGMRLSGGQVQRATAARALVRAPDLLVVDDLSSALDVETERLLWERLADAAHDGRGPATLLVVSHRRAGLEQADRIVVLDRGRVVGEGRLDELLEDCAEMSRLWTDELIAEAEEQTGAAF